MFDIVQRDVKSDLISFAKALDEKKSVIVENGIWIEQGFITRVINYIFSREDERLFTIINIAKNILNEIESGASVISTDQCVQFNKTIKKYLRVRISETIKTEVSDLKSRVISFKYRLNIFQKSQTDNLFNSILKLALDWQFESELFRHISLSEVQKVALKKVCQYPKFVNHLLKSHSEQESFFRWVLRHGNSVEAYIEFRNTVHKLMDCNLSTRIGYFGGKDLLIGEENNRKILKLPFQGIEQNITDERKNITLANDYVLSIGEIFQVFKDRALTIGNLEYFRDQGICNWNPKRLGSYNPMDNTYKMIDLNKECWWEEITPIEIITKEQASSRYLNREGRSIQCDGVNWVATIYGLTNTFKIEAEGNHAYLEMAIPTADGRFYYLYPFGKFSEEFPDTLWEKLKIAVENVPGVIMYPDENIFNLDRLKEGCSFGLTPHEGISRMTSIRKDLMNVRKGNFFFQLFNSNCLFWTASKMHHYITKKEMSDFCGVQFLEATPKGVLGYLWSILRPFPAQFHKIFFDQVTSWLGATKKIKITKKNGQIKEISLLDYNPWMIGERFPHPGCFVLRRLELLNSA